MAIKTKQLTPQDIAIYGHIMTTLRGALTKREWGAADLNQALGNDRGNAIVYQWLHGQSAPGPKYRAKLSSLLGLDEADLIAKHPAAKPKAAEPALPAVRPAVAAATPRRAEVLAFTVTDTGEARIRLDVVLPLETATPLLRMLLDAGIVFGATE